MKELKEQLKHEQHQQLISPKKSEKLLIENPDLPGEGCTTRDTCGKSNSSIGGGEDILF